MLVTQKNIPVRTFSTEHAITSGYAFNTERVFSTHVFSTERVFSPERVFIDFRDHVSLVYRVFMTLLMPVLFAGTRVCSKSVDKIASVQPEWSVTPIYDRIKTQHQIKVMCRSRRMRQRGVCRLF